MVKKKSSTVVENYLAQDNLEIIIGTLSSSLYYAKSIFNKKHVYFIENYEKLDETNKLNNNIDSIFKSLDI